MYFAKASNRGVIFTPRSALKKTLDLVNTDVFIWGFRYH